MSSSKLTSFFGTLVYFEISADFFAVCLWSALFLFSLERASTDGAGFSYVPFLKAVRGSATELSLTNFLLTYF
jgi:hypothetical protein